MFLFGYPITPTSSSLLHTITPTSSSLFHTITPTSSSISHPLHLHSRLLLLDWVADFE